MTYSNDPKHERNPDNINSESSKNNITDNETEPRTDSTLKSNLTPEKDEEVQRLIQEEKQVEKAQKLTIARKITQSISYLVGALEILLGLRFLLLVTGANSQNLFARFIYALSKPFSTPFSNLFGTLKFNGGNNIFDSNLLFGMVIYLLLMLLVNWLIKIITKP